MNVGSGDIVVALAYLAVAAGLSPAITLLALLSGGALAWTMAPQNRRARELGAALTATNREMFAVVSEFLGGLKMVKSYGAEARHSREFATRVGDIRAQLLEFTRLTSAVRMRHQIGSVVAVVSKRSQAVDVRTSRRAVHVLFAAYCRALQEEPRRPGTTRPR